MESLRLPKEGPEGWEGDWEEMSWVQAQPLEAVSTSGIPEHLPWRLSGIVKAQETFVLLCCGVQRC